MALQKAMLPATFFVFAPIWLFQDISFMNFYDERVQVHGYNFVVMIVDLVLNNQPLPNTRSASVPGIVAVGSYMVYSFVYPLTGGTFEDGRSPYVYKELDWANHFSSASLASLAAVALSPMVYLFCAALASQLGRIASHRCGVHPSEAALQFTQVALSPSTEQP